MSQKLALAPLDDEPFTDEDRLAVAEADEWRKHILVDFGPSSASAVTLEPVLLMSLRAPRHGGLFAPALGDRIPFSFDRAAILR